MTTTTFEIYVSRQVGDDLEERFHTASTDTVAILALASARDMLWGLRQAFPTGRTCFSVGVFQAIM